MWILTWSAVTGPSAGGIWDGLLTTAHAWRALWLGRWPDVVPKPVRHEVVTAGQVWWVREWGWQRLRHGHSALWGRRCCCIGGLCVKDAGRAFPWARTLGSLARWWNHKFQYWRLGRVWRGLVLQLGWATRPPLRCAGAESPLLACPLLAEEDSCPPVHPRCRGGGCGAVIWLDTGWGARLRNIQLLIYNKTMTVCQFTVKASLSPPNYSYCQYWGYKQCVSIMKSFCSRYWPGWRLSDSDSLRALRPRPRPLPLPRPRPGVPRFSPFSTLLDGMLGPLRMLGDLGDFWLLGVFLGVAGDFSDFGVLGFSGGPGDLGVLVGDDSVLSSSSLSSSSSDAKDNNSKMICLSSN